jgi:hypothetical protein
VTPAEYTPRTGREALVVELEREYRLLEHRAFWAGVGISTRIKPLTPPERERHAALRAWLRLNPPPGWRFRCSDCLLGTGDAGRICLGCRFG